MYIADISVYQGNIDWNKARKELDMVIFRASVGNKIDTKYITNAKECGIPFGVYHYFKAGTKEEAEEETKFFYAAATQDGLEPLFFCPDIEYQTQTSKTTKIVCQTILDTLRSLGAKKVGLYIGQSRYPYIKDIKDQFDFMWIPRYGKNTGLADENYAPKFPCDIWQYTSMGHIDGIPSRVDLNKLYGNKSLEWFIKKENNMPNRENEKFSNLHFVNFCKAFVGSPYWYGTCVFKCTETLLNQKTKQYPSHYTTARMSQYKKNIEQNKISSDCVGLIKGYAWTNGGEGVIESIGKKEKLFTNKSGSNGMPDKSANGMFEYAKSKGMEWGTIDTLPEIPGIAVRKDGHVGVYIGNGQVVEEKGFAYGCVISKFNKKNWLHWYKIPTIIYDENETEKIPESKTLQLGDRLLKRGMKGDDVKQLQIKLNEYLKLKLTTDGIFGAATESAVKTLQIKLNLTSDGKYGAQTHKSFMSMLGDEAPIIEETKQEEVEKIDNIYLNVKEDTEIRTADSYNNDIITVVKAGEQLIPILDLNKNPIVSENNWYAVKTIEYIGWVNAKYID